jgi:hypothetical protein
VKALRPLFTAIDRELGAGAPDQIANKAATIEFAGKVNLTSERKDITPPKSPTFFFLKVVEAQLEFAKDGSGKTIQVTLHQNGRDMVAKKK